MNALKFRISRSLAALRNRLAIGHAGRILACICVCAASASRANAEERRFAVMLAHSPKSFSANAPSNLPPGGLTSAETIRRSYFDKTDPSIDSFAEYWEEISYGDVVIQGDVLPWVLLPWPFAPDGPNMQAGRASPVDFEDLNLDGAYVYGSSELFCDESSSGDTQPALLPNKCGAAIIRDFRGNPATPQPEPRRSDGLADRAASGEAVWTPGERFLDVDGDNRWDGIDERNDQICNSPDGCRLDPQNGVYGVCQGTRAPCLANSDCVNALCVDDPVGSGPQGCFERGCGTLRMPCMDWDDDGDCNNCDGDGCIAPVLERCERDSECTAVEGLRDYYNGPLCVDGFCVPTECAIPTEESNCGTLLQCCEELEQEEREPGINCTNGEPGISCESDSMDTIVCCEFQDTDGDGVANVLEPFEDFIVRYDHQSASSASTAVRVTHAYIRANYPGDAEELIKRVGNGIYDPPDAWYDLGSTKMIRDAGPAASSYFVPKPGSDPGYARPPTSEVNWFDPFWENRYPTDDGPPPWPTGALNNVHMVEFDPEEPVPPYTIEVAPAGTGRPLRRWFAPNAGGIDGNGNGIVEDPNLELSTGTSQAPFQVLPDEEFGYFDGWVEHDDLASSQYHSKGDQRLGEITSPFVDLVDPPGPPALAPAIAGQDIGPHDPNQIGTPDNKTVAAGPGATNIHGSSGFDAGDTLITEYLTWRTDGKSRTSGAGWAHDQRMAHPYAGARVCDITGGFCSNDQQCLLSALGETCAGIGLCSDNGIMCVIDEDCDSGTCDILPEFGFADYNLDGLIDQGEVRPALSENYSVDSFPATPDDGTHTAYPFNRTRLMEDVVEALDNGVNWKVEFESDLERSGPSVSNIILVPPDAYDDINRFPTAPSLSHRVLTDDQDTPIRFGDLVICQNCRGFPSAVGYAAHEFLHTWENYPDLYDYDVFEAPQSIINCPIGIWDIMAGSRGEGGLVHPVAPLKEISDWVEAIDLRTVLTPGVETTITLPPAELDREGYYFLENEDAPKRCTVSTSAGEPRVCEVDADCAAGPSDRCVRGERYYFWSAGYAETFDRRFPGEGMLILKTTQVFAEAQALSEQQRRAPYNWEIIQADGRQDLDACSSDGNDGDAGDIWPGSEGSQVFNFTSRPPAVWNSQGRWIGLDISRVSEMDSSGAVRLTLSWQPTNIPSLRFLQPPGGESFNDAGRQVYSVRYEATDVGGETRLEFYYTEDPETEGTPIDYSIDPSRLIRGLTKGSGGTGEGSFRWDVTDIPDGRYRFFAKLEPFGSERKFTGAIPARGNTGDGAVEILEVDAGSSDSSGARSETWSIVCIDPDGDEWVVFSSLTEPLPEDVDPLTLTPATSCSTSNDRACTGDEYESRGGEVRFIINEGAVPFGLGDRFVFTTTGITAASEPVTVIDGAITLDPSAKIVASVLSGRPPLIVDFVVDETVNPTGGSLRFEWDFNDPTSGQPTAVGQTVRHTFEQPGTFSVVLRVVDSSTGRFSTDSVDIQVINNRPNAAISAAPRSGASPLVVNFNGGGSSDQESGSAGLTYSWDFGDGNTAVGAEPGLAQAVSNTYNCPGGQICTFIATLTVADPGGLTDTATTNITVGNTFPVAFVTATPREGRRPLTVVFNAINSSDPDGDALTVDWDFGDGTTLTDHPITGDTGEIGGAVRHTYMTSGVFTVETRVKDDAGGVSSPVQIQIEVFDPSVVNGLPVPRLAIRPSETRQAGQVFEFDASSSSDPDGDALSFAWNFGDNTTATGAQTSHSYSAVGRYEVVLDVTDEFGGSASLSSFVRVTEAIGNSAPTAIIATPPASATAGQTLQFDGSLSFDPDGDDLDFIWDFFDSDGETVDRLLGEVVTRTFDEVGTFEIVLTVRDGRGGESQSDPARVSIGAAQDGGGPTDPEPEQPEPGDNGNGEPPDSSNQRPTAPVPVCGLGMIFGFFGSLLGLFLMGVSRKRRTM